MVTQPTMNHDMQNSFRALADPTRRMILMHLTNKDMTIGEITGHFDITRAAVKKHLTILEQGKLISVHRNGRERINRLEPRALKSVSNWVNYFERFWDERLDKLKNVLETNKDNDND